jgi:hypothetical protein
MPLTGLVHLFIINVYPVWDSYSGGARSHMLVPLLVQVSFTCNLN